MSDIIPQTDAQAQQKYQRMVEQFGFPETQIDEGRMGIPLSRMTEVEEDWGTHLEAQTGTSSPFLTLSAVGSDDFSKDFIDAETRSHAQEHVTQVRNGVLTSGNLDGSLPIAVDPRIMDIVNLTAPEVAAIPTEIQPGKVAKYNVVNEVHNGGMASETDVGDLSDVVADDLGIQEGETPMKIYRDVVQVSDFAQAAAGGQLDYMDLQSTALGRHMMGYAVFKGEQFFYGDSSIGAADDSIQSANAYDGLATIADGAGNTVDKSGVTSDVLEDIRSELRDLYATTGLNKATAGVFIDTAVAEQLDSEIDPVVRMDTFDGQVDFGGRTFNILGAPVTETPNLGGVDQGMNGGSYATTNLAPSTGDAVIYDRSAVRFRALDPLSAKPLAETGLASRSVVYEFGALIDKSEGAHTKFLNGYGV